MNNSDRLKDKKIKTLEDQLKILQNSKYESDRQVFILNEMIVDFQNRLAFYRSGIEKGLEVKEMFLEEIPFSLQVDYEIANYKHLVNQIKRKSALVAWFCNRKIKVIIQNLEATKNEDLTLRKNSEENSNKNLKIVE